MNRPTEIWKNDFGKEYFARNPIDVDALNQLYVNNFGISRIDLNNIFIGDLDKSIKIIIIFKLINIMP